MDKYEEMAVSIKRNLCAPGADCEEAEDCSSVIVISEGLRQVARDTFKEFCNGHDLAYEITSRGGLSTSQLHTLHLIRLLANDLDPERPKFKSTLDSIEAQVQKLKKELNIDRPVQDAAIKSQKGVK